MTDSDSRGQESRAAISRIGGPVLHARVISGHFRTEEAVHIGPDRLLGEVMRLEKSTLVVQVYEDTSGLRPGDRVAGTGQPLSIRLGPGLLGRIFDGLLRPLDASAGEVHVRPGMFETEPRTFRFHPLVEKGDELRGGQWLGKAESEIGAHPCPVPPGLSGVVKRICGEGDRTDRETIAVVEGTDGREIELAMSHLWPVRRPRPVRNRLPTGIPLLTGQRIIDGLFPVARGGKAAMPGGFGTGKTILQQSLAKWCDADVIVYIGCGERGNEMTSVLQEFPALEDPGTGRPLMERSIIIANTSNMPVAAREASIYTGVTIAEYFRDLGMDAALLADSTSRWAEALREISGRLGELPGEGGYPAYLASRKAEFYERAGRVETLSGDRGSVTLIGAVSPPGGDFSEPVTLHTQRQVKSFWPLDRDRARARFFPAINPLQAYSEYVEDLGDWWREKTRADWPEYRQRFLDILQRQAHLERMARIVGKDALPPAQQLVLLCAELVNDAFLRQNAFSETDRSTSPARLAAMMRALVRFLDAADDALRAGVQLEAIGELKVIRRLRRMGEDLGDERVPEGFEELERDIDAAFRRLNDTAETETPAREDENE